MPSQCGDDRGHFDGFRARAHEDIDGFGIGHYEARERARKRKISRAASPRNSVLVCR
jgi:hypothetical protein